MESYSSYEDKLCVQFMARILQLKADHKTEDMAVEIALRDYETKILNELHPERNKIRFIDGSNVIYYERNNFWECNDTEEEQNNFDFNLN